MVKVRKKGKNSDVCEMSLLIERDEEFYEWDNNDLVKSIIEEVEIAESTAIEIAQKVRIKIQELCLTMGWKSIDTSFIREFVNNEIINLGKKYRKKAKKYNLIGLSPYEIKSIIENTNGGDNSNIRKNSPEAISSILSETIFKKYALQEVFSEEVVKNHYSGRIYLHDLGAPKIYCGSHSIVYIIKHGLKLPTVNSVSTPAKHAETLVKHVSTFIATISTIFSGACGLAAFNTFFAPFLVGMTNREIYQIAQSFVYSIAQMSTARSGQAVFTDANLDMCCPSYLKNTKALGPSGKYYQIKNDGQKDYLVECKKEDACTYEDLDKYTKQFFIELMHVFSDGDKNGTPFSFPKPLCHINDDSFLEKNKEAFESMLECASKNGSPYFLFDREDSIKVAQCCRLSVEMTGDDLKTVSEHPENSRFAALQNVTINLPHASLLCLDKNGISDKNKTIKKIKEAMDIAVLAHKEKFQYIKKLYNMENGPLDLAKNGMIGKKYIDLSNLTYLIGISGLNECVKCILDEELHDSEKAYDLGLYIIAEMSIYCQKLSKENNMKIVLEETPGESQSMKSAMTDCLNKEFGDKAKELCSGSYEDGNAYWTNSVHFKYSANISQIDRIIKQSAFHPMISGGSIVNLWIGENIPNVKSIENLIKKVYDKTKCTQLAISPEFTICEKCGQNSLGILNKCNKCGSNEVYSITRIVGYFSVIQSWNKNKKHELKERNKLPI